MSGDYPEEFVQKAITGGDVPEDDGDDEEWDPVLKRWVPKGRVYVSSPEEVPEGHEAQQGEQGGYYYETDEGGDDGEAGGDGVAGDIASYLDDNAASDLSDPDALEDLVAEYVIGHGEDPEDYGGVEALTEQVAEELGVSYGDGGGGEGDTSPSVEGPPAFESYEGIADALENSPEVDEDTAMQALENIEDMASDPEAPDEESTIVDWALEDAGVPREDRMAITDEVERGRLDGDDGRDSPDSRDDLEANEDEYQQMMDEMEPNMGSVLLPEPDQPDYIYEAFDDAMRGGEEGIEFVQESLHGGFFSDEYYDDYEDVMTDMQRYIDAD